MLLTFILYLFKQLKNRSAEHERLALKATADNLQLSTKVSDLEAIVEGLRSTTPRIEGTETSGAADSDDSWTESDEDGTDEEGGDEGTKKD